MKPFAAYRPPCSSPWRGRPSVATLSCLLLILLSAGAVSCGRSIPPLPTSGDKIRLAIDGKELTVEVACDDLSRETGLMFRESLPESAGMIFVYERAHKLSFWMRNTSVPLSIAFLDDAGKVLQIEDMHPHDESRTVSMYQVRYALEVNQGWFERNGIEVGDTFTGFREKVGPYRG